MLLQSTFIIVELSDSGISESSKLRILLIESSFEKTEEISDENVNRSNEYINIFLGIDYMSYLHVFNRFTSINCFYFSRAWIW